MFDILEFCVKNQVDMSIKCPEHINHAVTITMYKGYKRVRHMISVYELNSVENGDLFKYHLKKMLEQLNDEETNYEG